jgi:hypothetical protein
MNSTLQAKAIERITETALQTALQVASLPATYGA